MRQGQQNRRGRGRNRKSQNPLTRSFESNGPDVKIRGTPSHIAEKYVSLARDALSSGDRVLAENYLQHAEHYNRIIMAYREQQTQFGEGQQGGAGRQRDSGDNDGADGDDYDDVADDGLNGHMDAMPRGHEPQPSIFDGENANASSGERPKRRQNGHADNRADNRAQDSRGDTRRRSAEGGAGGDSEKSAEGANGERRPRRRERYANRDDQPDFLRRPIRKPRRSAESDEAADTPSSEDDGADGAVADNTSA